MAIPTKEEFESYLNVSRWSPCEDWLHEIEGISPSVDLIIPYLTKVHKAREEFSNILASHSVMVWWGNDVNAQYASRFMSNKRKSIQPMTWADYTVKRADHIVKCYKEISVTSFYSNLERDATYNPCALMRGVIDAFYNYHYTDRWMEVSKLGRTGDALLNETLKQLRYVQGLLDRVGELNPYYGGYSVLQKEFVKRHEATSIKRIIQRLDECLVDGGLLIPTRRNDDKARERVLVYDIWQVMRHQHISKPSPKVIATLLMTEGVVNPLDQRTVERLLSGWNSRRKELYRQSQRRRNDLTVGSPEKVNTS